MPPKINATITAPTETAAGYQAGGSSSRGSILIRQGGRFFVKVVSAMCRDSLCLNFFQWCARHHHTDHFDQTGVWFPCFNPDLTHNFSFIDYVHPITKRK